MRLRQNCTNIFSSMKNNYSQWIPQKMQSSFNNYRSLSNPKIATFFCRLSVTGIGDLGLHTNTHVTIKQGTTTYVFGKIRRRKSLCDSCLSMGPFPTA